MALKMFCHRKRKRSTFSVPPVLYSALRYDTFCSNVIFVHAKMLAVYLLYVDIWFRFLKWNPIPNPIIHFLADNHEQSCSGIKWQSEQSSKLAALTVRSSWFALSDCCPVFIMERPVILQILICNVIFVLAKAQILVTFLPTSATNDFCSFSQGHKYTQGKT